MGWGALYRMGKYWDEQGNIEGLEYVVGPIAWIMMRIVTALWLVCATT